MPIKVIGLALALTLAASAPMVRAETVEAVKKANVWQEIDITFWQTMPFAIFWTHLAERQISNMIVPGAATRWEIILPISAVIALGNAWVHNRRL
ncbi:hypothetical protein HZB07_01190 [Candidatus Saganbacteria bacterium]|nr:hypothetical protein [Candidatus Saganbacteria bacterium]